MLLIMSYACKLQHIFNLIQYIGHQRAGKSFEVKSAIVSSQHILETFVLSLLFPLSPQYIHDEHLTSHRLDYVVDQNISEIHSGP